MSKIDHVWQTTAPSKPDVYTTRRNQSKYLTLRYWDGEFWYEIAFTNSRGGTPFTWPKHSYARRPKYVTKDRPLFLRRISARHGSIQWGVPFKVYDEKEVLAYLVRTGVLPERWRTSYQDRMRAAEAAEKGGAA
jgi:hypothetical protein